MKVRNLGYPRIGRKRELKKALESYWSKQTGIDALETTAKQLCLSRWKHQHELGVDSVPVNDFSYYDHMLDMSVMLGAIPKRFEGIGGEHWSEQYFAMARGYKDDRRDVAALDMTKWFNTNYHYLVPEIDADTKFSLNSAKLDKELELAKTYKYDFHPVIIGPWTYVRLSRLSGITAAQVIDKIVPLYQALLKSLKARGLKWVQIDEPSICQDPAHQDVRNLRKVYEMLSADAPQIMLATYFESPDPWLSEVANYPVAALHYDLIAGPEALKWLKTRAFPKDKELSLGVISGRNVWSAALNDVRKTVAELCDIYTPAKIWLAPASSLLHLPHDKKLERNWDKEFLSWVSFADQRLEELALLKRSLNGDKTVESQFSERQGALSNRQSSPRIHRPEIKQAVERIDATMKTRKSPFAKRANDQKAALQLPPLPTTTIGSFPQTEDLRKVRLDRKKETITELDYNSFIEKEIERVVRLQEKLDLDVLVHGEPERNDMVEYFGGLLEGFAFADHAWVQSYGSRCVKPPYLFGDVKRKGPMTVDWFKYAQGLTKRPMKGMLTGPVTILNWSYVRDDQPREKTCFQIGLAIREEVKDLERAGAKVIQIDEAALREGLPIKRIHWKKYLKWATESFCVGASVVRDETQIQTHMCYSEFGDIMEAVRELDADVLLIEYARSGPTFGECFKKNPYPNQIGPGVYDIHSPRVPSVEECEASIKSLLGLFPSSQLWVNPDCGLKTRKYEECENALSHLVEGTKRVRVSLNR